jgi:CubicO group peptidase (beta-lactamase class C family)
MRILAAFLLVAATAFAGRPHEGIWNLVLDRPGMEPRRATGRLVLGADGGTLAFDVILYARTHELKEFEAKGSKVSFRVAEEGFELTFRGEVKKGVLAGRCDWKGLGAYEWTAEKVRIEPQERFEKGLSFAGFFPKGDAKFGGGAIDLLLDEAKKRDTDAVLILKDGKVVCERYFGRKPDPCYLMSVTKVFAAIAVAMLLDEGKIPSLDAPLSTWFPEWAEGDKAKVTLRHVLTHTSGIEHAPRADTLNQQKDRLAYVRQARLAKPPGEEWSYNNDAIMLLSGVIAQAAGKQADDYLRERLFDPLGIKDWTWQRDEAGSAITYAQLRMTARDLARVGQWILGSSGGTIKPETLKLLASPATPLDKAQGLVWRLRFDAKGKAIGYGHDGWLGQFLAIYPERRIVAIRLRQWKDSPDLEKPEHSFGAFFSMVEAAD